MAKLFNILFPQYLQKLNKQSKFIKLCIYCLALIFFKIFTFSVFTDTIFGLEYKIYRIIDKMEYESVQYVIWCILDSQ